MEAQSARMGPGPKLDKVNEPQMQPQFNIQHSKLTIPTPSPFCLALALSLALSAPYSNSSRRDFTAEAQRGKRSLRKNKRRLNTKVRKKKRCFLAKDAKNARNKESIP